jgi:hypothetical protein
MNTLLSRQSDIQDLFDEYGCRNALETANVNRNLRRRYICAQPEINYTKIHARISTHLGDAESISALEFELRAESILNQLRNNPTTRRITNGVHVPFFLPKAIHADIGKALDEYYLPAVESSFQSMFPKFTFTNYHKTGLSGKLSVAEGSRHDQVVHTMSERCVVGYYFPCLLEYSIPEAIKQMQQTPDACLLAGGFDTCAAFVGSPDLLLRMDAYPPLLWLAGLAGKNVAIGYHFEAYGYNLTFNRRPHFGQAAEYWTSSLVVLG